MMNDNMNSIRMPEKKFEELVDNKNRIFSRIDCATEGSKIPFMISRYRGNGFVVKLSFSSGGVYPIQIVKTIIARTHYKIAYQRKSKNGLLDVILKPDWKYFFTKETTK